MEFVVYGAGSLGSLVGGLLARDHDVTLVGRDPHVAAVRRDGLTISGHDTDTVTPAATTDGTGLSAAYALVTVKAFDTAEAARALATGSFDAVCSLQNGLGNEATLADHVPCPVLAGVTTHGARLVEPGHVEWTGAGDVAVGDPAGGDSRLATRLARGMDAVGLDATAATDMPTRAWRKLAVNAGINAVTALARVENGALAADERGGGHAVAREAARETARVARARGVALSADAAVDALETVVADTARNTSSMLQDVEAGERTEIDAINGYVLARAPDADAVPVNATLARLVRTWEAARGLR